MSQVKISSNLFLETAELNRLKRFFVVDGHKTELLLNTKNYGIVRDNKLFTVNYPQQDAFKIIPISGGNFDVGAGAFVDNSGNVILNKVQSYGGFCPSNNSLYWVKLKYATSNLEEGTVDIALNGLVTGTNTKFTEILRGVPNFPSKVKFYGGNNITSGQDFEIAEVIDDTHLVLNTAPGNLFVETGLTYGVVGTFTPGWVPATQDKMIFEYDSYSITLYQSATEPVISGETAGENIFWLGTVQFDGATFVFKDLRARYVWQTKADYELDRIPIANNPLIAVKSINFQRLFQTKDCNIAILQHAFSGFSFSFDYNSNSFIINSGQGGAYASIADVNANDFDGWRLINVNTGNQYKISQTSVPAGIPRVTIEMSDFADIAACTRILICPDYEDIEIRVQNPSFPAEPPISFIFPTERENDRMEIPVIDYAGTTYDINYRYRHQKQFSQWTQLVTNVYGYTDELGATIAPSNSNILFKKDPTSIILNDVNGWNYQMITSPTVANIDLTPGVDVINQRIFFAGYTQTQNQTIHIMHTNAVKGSRFNLEIDCAITPHATNVYSIVIEDDYGGGVYFAFTGRRLVYGISYISLIFDGTNWQVMEVADGGAGAVSDQYHWSDITPINGWVVGTNIVPNPQYRRINKYTVQLRGDIRNSTFGGGPPNLPFFILPVGYRPPHNAIFSVPFSAIDNTNRSTVNAIFPMWCMVKSTGECFLDPYPTAIGDTVSATLDSVRFETL